MDNSDIFKTVQKRWPDARQYARGETYTHSGRIMVWKGVTTGKIVIRDEEHQKTWCCDTLEQLTEIMN